ncbi:MAG: leucine-rich repeat domain-containing protein [Bacteroidales bacterium]|nr:leucine-rich repeat domain-containing protein [Bacteroidales bacterium]
MKKLITIFLTLFVASSVWAYDFEYEGFYYNLIDGGVEVTYKWEPYESNEKAYTGDITIPEYVTYSGKKYRVISIGPEAFSNCSGVTSISLPNTIISIGVYAFAGTGITSIKIPSSVTSISWGFVEECNITSITIPNSVIDIDEDLIYGCTTLKEYIGPAEAFNFEEYDEFYNDTDEYIPREIERIAITRGALNRIGFDYINLFYRSLQEIDLSGLENTEILDEAFNNCYKLKKVTLPSQLESIGYKSFAGCTALEGISIPASVTKIDNSAFEDCRSMSKIVFDGSELKASTSNLETIGKWAFYNCHNLQNIEIPEGVTSIGDAAFYGCTYLQNLKLPSTLKSLGDNTFALCENLKSLTVLAENPPSLYEKSFYNVDHTIPVSVPESSLKSYEETPYWSEFIHYKSADATAINGVSNTTAVTIANNQIFVNGEAPAFVVTVSGQKIANANLKAGVYFVVAEGETVKVVVR